MAKEQPAEKSDRRAEKTTKKEKRSEKDGVHKSKKQKKEKKPLGAADAAESNVVTPLLNTLEDEKPGSVLVKEDADVEVKVKSAPLIGALVPFANPLADEKVGKKVLKSVKKGRVFHVEGRAA